MAIYTSKFTQQEIDDGIDNANSAVQPKTLAGYLPLTGGTITSSNVKPLVINSTASTKDSYVTFNNNGTILSFLGYDRYLHTFLQCGTSPYPAIGVLDDGTPYYVANARKTPYTFYTLLHEGNYSSYALPLSGGTITSSETNPLNIKSTNTTSTNVCFVQFITKSGKTSEFGYWNNTGAYIQNTSATGTTIINIHDNGNVGINASTPSYKLHVGGAVGATVFTNTSDIRKKDILENINIDVEDIANAPIFKFSWLDPEMPDGVNVGTSAQYWQTIIPELVSAANDDEKTLSMQYGVAGLASSIALARKVVEQENTIKAQEARIKALEDAIAEIQNKLK